MDKSVRRALETHVADNPVFVFFHEDGQVEVISSYPYLGAEEDTFAKAVQLWLICIDEWAKDFESGEISLQASYVAIRCLSAPEHITISGGFYPMYLESYVLNHLSKQGDGHGAKARPFNLQADRNRPFKAWLYTEKTSEQRPSQAVQKSWPYL